MDTPKHIKEMQLRIWLSKSPAERLQQFFIDNDALLNFCSEAKKSITVKSKNQ